MWSSISEQMKAETLCWGKNQNTSWTALENLIKSKSTFKSVNFGVWIQKVYQYHLRGWRGRDVQHFQSPCVSLYARLFGTWALRPQPLSSTIPPCDCLSLHWLSPTELGFLAEQCLRFLSLQRQILIFSWFFKHLGNRRKPTRQEADV